MEYCYKAFDGRIFDGEDAKANCDTYEKALKIANASTNKNEVLVKESSNIKFYSVTDVDSKKVSLVVVHTLKNHKIIADAIISDLFCDTLRYADNTPIGSHVYKSYVVKSVTLGSFPLETLREFSQNDVIIVELNDVPKIFDDTDGKLFVPLFGGQASFQLNDASPKLQNEPTDTSNEEQADNQVKEDSVKVLLDKVVKIIDEGKVQIDNIKNAVMNDEKSNDRLNQCRDFVSSRNAELAKCAEGFKNLKKEREQKSSVEKPSFNQSNLEAMDLEEKLRIVSRRMSDRKLASESKEEANNSVGVLLLSEEEFFSMIRGDMSTNYPNSKK